MESLQIDSFPFLSLQPLFIGSSQPCPEDVLVVGETGCPDAEDALAVGSFRGLSNLKQAQRCPLILQTPGHVGGLISISQIKNPKTEKESVNCFVNEPKFSRHPKAGKRSRQARVSDSWSTCWLTQASSWVTLWGSQGLRSSRPRLLRPSSAPGPIPGAQTPRAL